MRVVQLEAGPVRPGRGDLGNSVVRVPRQYRASDTRWQGERAGSRGEVQTARMPVWDEPQPRVDPALLARVKGVRPRRQRAAGGSNRDATGGVKAGPRVAAGYGV